MWPGPSGFRGTVAKGGGTWQKERSPLCGGLRPELGNGSWSRAVQTLVHEVCRLHLIKVWAPVSASDPHVDSSLSGERNARQPLPNGQCRDLLSKYLVPKTIKVRNRPYTLRASRRHPEPKEEPANLAPSASFLLAPVACPRFRAPTAARFALSAAASPATLLSPARAPGITISPSR